VSVPGPEVDVPDEKTVALELEADVPAGLLVRGDDGVPGEGVEVG
jgi:hypothetical protein